jgi:hypothetical protein
MAAAEPIVENEDMSRWIVAGLFALIACQENHPAQVIRLDDAHNAMSPATANGVPNYSVRSDGTYASPSGMYAFDWPAGANLKSRESVIVMVGCSEPGASSDKLTVVPFWLGRVSVK